MLSKWLKITLLLLLAMAPAGRMSAQRVIEYVAGMGTRDPDNPDIWILYQNVKAMHDGMTLYTDSASFDTKNNIFVAHRNVKMVITDTTTLYGSTAVYDGTTLKVYVDGAVVLNGAITAVKDSNNKLCFGTKGGLYNGHFTGLFDEFRLRDAVSSADWVQAECDQMSSSFLIASAATDISGGEAQPARTRVFFSID